MDKMGSVAFVRGETTILFTILSRLLFTLIIFTANYDEQGSSLFLVPFIFNCHFVCSIFFSF